MVNIFVMLLKIFCKCFVVKVVIDMWFFWFVDVGNELIDVGCVRVLFLLVSVV